MLNDYVEKRSTPRISVNVNCSIMLENGKETHTYSGVVKDISNDGICIRIENKDSLSSFIKEAKDLKVKFVAPVLDTLEKGVITVKLYERWTSERDNHIFVGGIYEICDN